MRDRRTTGATLLEILMAMIVIGLVAGGILTAFIFGRRVTWRSGSELSGSGLVQETADNLRASVGGGGPAGLSLNPGVYVDNNMQNPPTGFTRVLALNFPAAPDFGRFQTDGGTAGPTIIPATHGDGRLVVVDGVGTAQGTNDLDGDGIWPMMDANADGFGDLDFDHDGVPDLRRVRVRVKWTSPTS